MRFGDPMTCIPTLIQSIISTSFTYNSTFGLHAPKKSNGIARLLMTSCAPLLVITIYDALPSVRPSHQLPPALIYQSVTFPHFRPLRVTSERTINNMQGVINYFCHILCCRRIAPCPSARRCRAATAARASPRTPGTGR